LATEESISTPRLIGPGCITIASDFANARRSGRLIAPAGLQYDSKQCAAVSCFDHIEEGIKNCDVVMVL
jgi:hypothetical protein